jgi:hypothetical protein
MVKDEILNKLRKIKALAEGGDIGEKSAAEEMLRKLMVKYGVSEEDLNSEKESVHYFCIHGCKCKELFRQVAIIYCGVDRMHYFGNDAQDKAAKVIRRMAKDRPKGSNMGVICTSAKFLELQYAYDIFQKSFDQHVEGLFYGFLDTNNLLAPYNPDNPKSDMDDETIDIASRMGLAVKRTKINKALPQNKLPK